MPIESYFFPREALQGEDLPSHVIWSDLTYDFIRIVHSKKFALTEIYNVSKNDVLNKEEGVILISKVEVDGYLGLVLSSKILPEKSVDEVVEYSFLFRNQVMEHLTFNVHLFRPDVVVSNIPSEISVNTASGEASPKILVRNLGEGTAIIDIETPSESALPKKPS